MAVPKDFAIMKHLVNAVATFATELFQSIDGEQRKIGGLDRQTAQVASFEIIIGHRRSGDLLLNPVFGLKNFVFNLKKNPILLCTDSKGS